jgi:pilus assembly protein CpaB
MKSYGRVAIIGALAAAAIAAVSHVRYAQSLEATRQVVVIRKEVKPFEKLAKEHVHLVEVPAKSAAAKEIMTSVDEVVDKYARGFLVVGQPVHQSHLMKTAGSSLSANLTATQDAEAEYRAMALQVSVDTGVASTLQPGDEVDILVAFKGEGSAQQKSTSVAKIIAQKVVVMHTTFKKEQSSTFEGGSASEEGTVVLKVTPEQAEDLAFAQIGGTIWLLTRPQGASERSTSGVTMESFMAKHGIRQSEPATPVKPPVVQGGGSR